MRKVSLSDTAWFPELSRVCVVVGLLVKLIRAPTYGAPYGICNRATLMIGWPRFGPNWLGSLHHRKRPVVPTPVLDTNRVG